MKPIAGRLFATAGWAAKPRSVLGDAARAVPPAAGEAPTRVGVRSLVAVSSLISLHRHAHDVLVGGQQSVPDLQRRLEADRRLLARQHHRGDVGGLAALIGFGDRRGLGLDLVDLVRARRAARRRSRRRRSRRRLRPARRRAPRPAARCRALFCSRMAVRIAISRLASMTSCSSLLRPRRRAFRRAGSEGCVR